jgi:hypothetical protein
MAVVQISRIQHRRGKKLEGTGIPQLASGEIGWAIDTQELYIGNGSVSEGAPTVGNTKVLTEADDIFSLANQYAYKKDTVQTGSSIGSPNYRLLQDKLDDVVSVRDFGAPGDGTDQTEAIQRAINELYLKSSTKGLYSARVTLHFPAGEYLISGNGLFLPPFANIKGDGKDKTYINAPESSHVFRTVNEDSAPLGATPNDINGFSFEGDNTSQNQARGIYLGHMTIYHNSYGAALYLENCRDSVFDNIRIKGSWTSGDGINEREPGAAGIVVTPTVTSFIDHTVNLTGVYIDNYVASAASDFNRFYNCDFQDLGIGIYSDYDINYNQFQVGTINEVGYGFLFGLNSTGAVGQQNGPCHNTIENYEFILVDREAIKISRGKSNISERNRFRNVGNDGGNSANALYPVIEFADAQNQTIRDFFQRTAELCVDPLFNTGNYPSEVKGAKMVELSYPISTSIGNQPALYKVAQFPVEEAGNTILIEYSYSADITPGPVYRVGKMKLIWNTGASQTHFSDEYDYTGNTSFTGAELAFQVNRLGNKLELKCLNSFSPVTDRFEFTMKVIAGEALS